MTPPENTFTAKNKPDKIPMAPPKSTEIAATEPLTYHKSTLNSIINTIWLPQSNAISLAFLPIFNATTSFSKDPFNRQVF